MMLGLAAAMLLLVACGGGAGEGSEPPAAAPESLFCEWYVRPDMTEAPALAHATQLDAALPEDRFAAGDFAVTATFTPPGQPEGPTAVLIVADAATGREISRGLYQFDRSASQQPRFVGGHGFTGLHYVYHPATGAELQYFCAPGEPAAP